MTVQDLITQLQKFDLNTEIVFESSIESGRSLSILNEGYVDLEQVEDYEYEITEDFDQEEYDGDGLINEEDLFITIPGKVLVFSISGEETSSQ